MPPDSDTPKMRSPPNMRSLTTRHRRGTPSLVIILAAGKCQLCSREPRPLCDLLHARRDSTSAFADGLKWLCDHCTTQLSISTYLLLTELLFRLQCLTNPIHGSVDRREPFVLILHEWLQRHGRLVIEVECRILCITFGPFSIFREAPGIDRRQVIQITTPKSDRGVPRPRTRGERRPVLPSSPRRSLCARR